MIENIYDKNDLLAIILRANYQKEGISFFTPSNFSQQLGYMKREKGYIIQPHVHKPVERSISFTKEVLFLKRGKVRIDFYNDLKEYLFSKVLNQFDVVLLAKGGHGFEVLEESEIIEVKQGPYAGEADKERFEMLAKERVFIKED